VKCLLDLTDKNGSADQTLSRRHTLLNDENVNSVKKHTLSPHNTPGTHIDV